MASCFLGALSNLNEDDESNKNENEKEKKNETIEKKENKEKKVYKLTQYSSGLGCACKMKPQNLDLVLKSVKKAPLTQTIKENLLVGNSDKDDASVYKINENQAVVQTLDFFPPIVDDPKTFGKISATNALSDIFAMGATPITALSIVGFPSDKLPLSVLTEIMNGAEEACKESNCCICGGHTIEDLEPKFGLSVTGIVHPDKLFQNNTTRDGDIIILTKKIGTGIVTTSLKKKLITEEKCQPIYNSMMKSNGYASQLAQQFNEKYKNKDNIKDRMISAMTDVTGFGLSGHLLEMITNSDNLKKGKRRVALLSVNKLPIFEEAKTLLKKNQIHSMAGGQFTNQIHAGKSLRWVMNENLKNEEIKDFDAFICDPQTSGGLLLTVKPEKAEELLKEIQKKNPEARIIGKIIDEDIEKNDLEEKGKENQAIIIVNDDLDFTKNENIIKFYKNLKWWNDKYDFDFNRFISGMKKKSQTTKSETNTVNKTIVPKILLLKSDIMGSGDPVLGKKLMLGFFGTILGSDKIPAKVILVNDAINLCIGKDERFTKILKKLESFGCDIVPCGTCLDQFAVNGLLKVGRIGTAKENVELFLSSKYEIVTIS